MERCQTTGLYKFMWTLTIKQPLNSELDVIHCQLCLNDGSVYLWPCSNRTMCLHQLVWIHQCINLATKSNRPSNYPLNCPVFDREYLFHPFHRQLFCNFTLKVFNLQRNTSPDQMRSVQCPPSIPLCVLVKKFRIFVIAHPNHVHSWVASLLFMEEILRQCKKPGKCGSMTN